MGLCIFYSSEIKKKMGYFTLLLQVVVADNETQLTRFVQLTLTEPVVNRPPQFAQEQYMFSISENSTDAEEIGSLSITDEGLMHGIEIDDMNRCICIRKIG